MQTVEFDSRIHTQKIRSHAATAYASSRQEQVLSTGAVTLHFYMIGGRAEYNRKPQMKISFVTEMNVIKGVKPRFLHNFDVDENGKVYSTEHRKFDATGQGSCCLLNTTDGQILLHGFTIKSHANRRTVIEAALWVFTAIIRAIEHMEIQEPAYITQIKEEH